jgi:hypothetical protein
MFVFAVFVSMSSGHEAGGFLPFQKKIRVNITLAFQGDEQLSDA